MSEIQKQFQAFSKLTAIFIGGLARSGTSLMLRLLDGHPKLLVHPIENCILRDFFEAPPTHPVRKGIEEGMGSRDAQKIFDHLKTNPRAWRLTRVRTEGEGEIVEEHSSFNVEGFEKCFLETLSGVNSAWDIHHLLQVWLFSYFWTLKKRDMSLYSGWVIKCPSAAKYYKTYADYFPERRIIHLMRDPRAVYLSAREKKTSAQNQEVVTVLLRKRPLLGVPLLMRFYKDEIDRAQAFAKAQRVKFTLIKYEDLVNFPQDQMEKISHFLNIPYDPILAMPTFGGRPWVANSSFEVPRDQSGKIFEDSSKRWEKGISVWERLLFGVYFSKTIKEWNYPRY
ncbi:MAG: sulfotransferase [Candidatus Omnitrophica bacterium]|nr:sulfotransferase [Candidatus Omnitrophota bacterium]